MYEPEVVKSEVVIAWFDPFTNIVLLKLKVTKYDVTAEKSYEVAATTVD
jgi:hypothetical protein